MKTQTFLILLSLGVLASCKPLQQSTEFFESHESVIGADALCVEGTNDDACLALPGCKSAYGEDPEGGQGAFEACLVDPEYEDPNSSGSAEGGDSSGGDSGSSAGGSSGGSSGSSAGGSSGGSTGGNNGGAAAGSAAGGSSGGDDSDDDGDSLADVQKDCSGVDAKYLYVKKLVKENGEEKLVKKAKVCHHSHNNGKHRTIVIGCPAVKPHVKHHEDYLGVCSSRDE